MRWQNIYFEETAMHWQKDVLLIIPLCYRLTEAEQQTLTVTTTFINTERIF